MLGTGQERSGWNGKGPCGGLPSGSRHRNSLGQNRDIWGLSGLVTGDPGLARIVNILSDHLAVDFEGSHGSARVIFSLHEFKELARVVMEVGVGLVAHACDSVLMEYPHGVYDTLYQHCVGT